MANKPNPKNAENNDPETTGHEWDGIQEFNNPMPGWWVWTFYATIIWAIGYTIAYPAWPLIKGATPGLLGWSTRGDVAAEIQSFTDMNADLDAQLATIDLTAIRENEEVYNYAVNPGNPSGGAGGAVFRTFCVQCHGSGAEGAKGYPNLLDDDWLWGGDIEAIQTSVTYGIRAVHDDTRLGDMPAHDWLEAEQVDQIAEYVLSLSGNGSDGAAAEAGAVLFEDEGCSGCHDEGGVGVRDLGAPNLTDAIWLFGGDKAAITETIMGGRKGEMPNWNAKLSASQINAVSAYVHQLGGGE